MALLTIGGALRASGQGRLAPEVIMPGSSVERAEDRGARAHTHLLLLAHPAKGLGPRGGLTPAQLQAAYGLPATGGSQIIAIVDAYDYPTALNDFNVFAAKFGLPQETSSNVLSSANQVFQVVYAGGSRPTMNGGWALEEGLDIEWAHAMAPNAKIVLVEAKSNTLTDLFAAVDVATNFQDANGLLTREVSMSWSSGEFLGEAAYDEHLASQGVVYLASTGDKGAPAGYPSLSPNVVAAGGTTVNTDSSGNFVSETGWSGSGGGPSAYESRPSYQDSIQSLVGTARGAPDLSFDADPHSGVCIYDTAASWPGWVVVGGTSVASPSLAGIVNLASTAAGGFASGSQDELGILYSNLGSADFRDITSGNNGYAAGPGWDFVTGVGSVQGLAGLQPPATTPGLFPGAAPACGPSFTLTVTGRGFESGAVAQWTDAGGATTALSTTFVSASEVTALVPAALIAGPGTASVTVVNPDGSASAPLTFTITNPVPVVTGIQPASVNAAGPAFTPTVTGSCFLGSSVIHWNGSALTTTVVSSGKLTATVPASDITTPGTAQITVVTPGPGGGVSDRAPLTVLTTTLKFVSATLSQDSSGVYTAVISLQNTGYLTAQNVAITAASLGSAATSTSLPVSAGSIAAGAKGSAMLTFPASAGAPGSKVALKLSGTFTGGKFTGSLRVMLP
ncbi:MAG TPA: hypothetical protein VKT32_02570 [Chthonomonadaceae bacterium]|nr:hypothetical protein [Chthonomonadaceae bacterium]